MKRIRHLIEYGLARILLLLVDTLPFPISCRVARGAANLWWVFDHQRRKVARDNIMRCGIETDPKRAANLARGATHHMAQVIVETLRSHQFLTQEKFRDHVDLKVKPDVLAALENPDQGLIIASGHFGNWEVAAHFLSRYKPVVGITRRMNNPLMDKLVQSRKASHRFRPIPKRDSNSARFLEVLENKEILALLFDQHAPSKGMLIDFFGRPAATFKTMAMLHLVTRTPLCFGSCRRIGPLKFELSTSHLIQCSPSGNKEDDIRAILTQLTQRLEEAIRQAPEQYLWGHRRWRDQTPAG